MEFRAAILDGVNELLSDLGNASGVAPFFVWQSVNIPCIPSHLDTGSETMIGGNVVEISVILTVRVSEFLSADSTLVTVDSTQYTVDSGALIPLVGKVVSFRQENLRILHSTLDASSAFFRLTLGSPNS